MRFFESESLKVLTATCLRSVFFCGLVLSASISLNCYAAQAKNRENRLMPSGSEVTTGLLPIAQKSKSDAGYTVQGKPVSKQQYEAVKLHDEGLLLMRTNANEQALQKFKQSIELYDGYAEVHHSLALANAKLGNRADAIKELQRAIELNSNLDESWLLLAGFYQTGGNLQESINAYNEYLRRFPNNPMASKVNVTLGLLYARLGKSDEAITELKHSIETNPNLSASWITLGGVYQAKGDIANAIDTYSKYKERFPSDAMIPKINGLLSALVDEQKRREKNKVDDAKLGVPIDGGGESTPGGAVDGPNASNPAQAKDDYLGPLMTRSGAGVTIWPRMRIPISVYINDGAQSSGYKDSYKNILRRSFEDWAKASGGLISFTIVESPAQARLKCFWTDKVSELHNPSEAGDARLFEDQSYISHAEIWFLTQPLSRAMPLTENTFRLIALHEIGHALGLNGHTSNPEDIMFYSTTFKDSWRELSGRDSRTIRKLYQSDI